MVKAALSLIARKWPFVAFFGVGYAVGYALGGHTSGGALGGGFGAASYLMWSALRNRAELVAYYRQLKRDHHPREADPLSDRRPKTLIVWVALAHIVALFGYNLLIAGAHDSYLLADWTGTLRPSADWLAKYVPALERIPRAMIQNGYGGWAPVAHHLLFVDWVLTIAMMALTLFYVAFVQGRAFSQQSSYAVCSS
jgi:hypothetical protein